MRKSNGKIEKEFTKQLVSRLGDKLEMVILFGSRAKGTANRWSDYDILLVMPKKDDGTIRQVYALATDFQLQDNADISLKIRTTLQFEKAMRLLTPFMKEIKQTGVTLWKKPSRK